MKNLLLENSALGYGNQRTTVTKEKIFRSKSRISVGVWIFSFRAFVQFRRLIALQKSLKK